MLAVVLDDTIVAEQDNLETDPAEVCAVGEDQGLACERWQLRNRGGSAVDSRQLRTVVCEIVVANFCVI